MTEQSTPTDPGVEGTVAQPGGVSYLGIPARDVREASGVPGMATSHRNTG